MSTSKCLKCGGSHCGKDCSYTLAPCSVCGEPTILACADCAITTGNSIHVCSKIACRDEHEKVHYNGSIYPEITP